MTAYVGQGFIPEWVSSEIVNPTTTSTVPPTPNPRRKSSGPSVGIIVAAVVGGVAVLVIGAVVVFCLLKRRKKKSDISMPAAPGQPFIPGEQKPGMTPSTQPGSPISPMFSPPMQTWNHAMQGPPMQQTSPMQNLPMQQGAPMHQSPPMQHDLMMQGPPIQPQSLPMETQPMQAQTTQTPPWQQTPPPVLAPAPAVSPPPVYPTNPPVEGGQWQATSPMKDVYEADAGASAAGPGDIAHHRGIIQELPTQSRR